MSAARPPGSHPIGLRRFQKGLTLIELMVSMVLALLVMAAAGIVYLNASRNLIQQDAEGRLQQSGTAALALVTQQLQKAGMVDMRADWPGWKDDTPGMDRFAFLMNNISPAISSGRPPATLHGCDSGYGRPADLASNDCAQGTGSPALTLAWQVRRTGADFAERLVTPGCLGESSPRALPTAQVNNLTDTNAQGQAEAVSTTWTVCRISLNKADSALQFTQNTASGSGNATTASVIDNIVDLRFKYLMAGAGQRARLTHHSDTAAGLQWADVAGVEVCLLLRVHVTDRAPANSTYTDCKGEQQPHVGTYLHRAVRGVVVLRSRVHAIHSALTPT